MLTLTPTAVEVVRSLTSDDGVPEGTGLRIANQDGRLALALAPQPDDADRVISGEGARLFLDDSAAAYLDDKILDAAVDDQGNPTFTLASQQPPTAAP
ncbi:iron-sulfur cluster biosynthesis protein [Kutzneria sp. NPDC052558]|uniref:iron-sulfur cluster biosynthesis protein n=1 Tax=Kutzneria sp. NPDC052558 TaxID=3364121 RepID=UPI0037C92795